MRVHFGGDYNPEQWDESVWPEDMRLMHEAGVTMVSVGIFAWSRLQPAEGVFDFTWLDRVLELLHGAGIGVDLATATASPPPWASAKYPDILAVDAAGSTYWPGSRQHYAPTSPSYRRLALALVEKLAERYANHPAVLLWHVNNEYACHLRADYSDSARDAFRTWLGKRYGSIDALNVSWGTAFWSQVYQDFAEVYPPRSAPYSHNPGQLLDYQRFTSDSLLECFVMERDAIKAAGAIQPVTTNFMGAFKPVDYWRWAREVDVVSDDCYPDPADPWGYQLAAFQHDLMRSLKPGLNWMLMEQAPNAVNWRNRNLSRAPGETSALSAQAYGRGASSILFFQWRQSKAGAEKFLTGMLPQAGTRAASWHEMRALGHRVAGLRPLTASTQDAKVAIVLDWENWWAVENPDHPAEIDYLSEVQQWHRALFSTNVQVAFVHPDASLDAYELVVVPCLYLLSENGARNLDKFVQEGGTLLVTPFSDIVDERDHFRPGGFQAQIRRTVGLQVEDFRVLPADKDVEGIPTVFEIDGIEIGATHFAEKVLLDGCEVVERFTSGPFQTEPALTRMSRGEGLAYYLTTIPSEQGKKWTLEWLCQSLGISPVVPDLAAGVEAARCGDIVTVVNHGNAPIEFALVGVDHESGAVTGRIRLAPGEFRFVHTGDSNGKVVS